MRLVKVIYITLFIGLGFIGFAQENSAETLNGNLEQQFDYVYKRSNNYQIYKVVSKNHFEHLKKSSLDSIKVYKKEIDDLSLKLSQEIQERENINSEFTTLNEEFIAVKQQKDEVSFFGISLDNGLFNMIILGVIIFLGLLLFFFVMKFRGAKSEANAAVDNLSKLEDEYVDYKRRAIEKEQQLGRKLQDEINKHKN